MNKSLITNLIALFAFVIAYFAPDFIGKKHVQQASLFALSGAATNWLAIYMLFEKIPGIYGSGIVPNRFQEFKKAIHKLIMNNFFTRENFDKYVTQSLEDKFDIDQILDQLFEELRFAVETSSLGSVLAIFNKQSMFDSWRQPFKDKSRKFLDESGIIQKLTGGDAYDKLKPQVDMIVNSKLEELTPTKVKEIIQNMIRKHLGWLVVWGGIFGAIIGVLCSVFLK